MATLRTLYARFEGLELREDRPGREPDRPVIEVGQSLPAAAGPGREVAVNGDAPDFPIPSPEGRTAPEMLDEVAPAYLQTCLRMADKAIRGMADPMQGDLPHKMALLLAHKMIPTRKFNDKLPEESPAEVKRIARALRAIINSNAEDAIITSEVESIVTHGSVEGGGEVGQ